MKTGTKKMGMTTCRAIDEIIRLEYVCCPKCNTVVPKSTHCYNCDNDLGFRLKK